MKTTQLLKEQIERLGLSRFLNKYVLTLLVFATWMIFFDQHNMIVQTKLVRTIDALTEKIAQDDEQIAAANQELLEMEESKEVYAREKYRMHRDDEEVFVIVSDQ